jgi:hypothetical protein
LYNDIREPFKKNKDKPKSDYFFISRNAKRVNHDIREDDSDNDSQDMPSLTEI